MVLIQSTGELSMIFAVLGMRRMPSFVGEAFEIFFEIIILDMSILMVALSNTGNPIGS